MTIKHLWLRYMALKALQYLLSGPLQFKFPDPWSRFVNVWKSKMPGQILKTQHIQVKQICWQTKQSLLFTPPLVCMGGNMNIQKQNRDGVFISATPFHKRVSCPEKWALKYCDIWWNIMAIRTDFAGGNKEKKTSTKDFEDNKAWFHFLNASKRRYSLDNRLWEILSQILWH